MNRGPQPGSRAGKTDMVVKAKAAWLDCPDWVIALAEACNSQTQVAVASRLGVSSGLISGVIGGTYGQKGGDLGRIEALVRGAYMGATVLCPVLSEIGRDRCLEEQKQPFRATSAMRAQLYHACQKCQHRRGGAA